MYNIAVVKSLKCKVWNFTIIIMLSYVNTLSKTIIAKWFNTFINYRIWKNHAVPASGVKKIIKKLSLCNDLPSRRPSNITKNVNYTRSNAVTHLLTIGIFITGSLFPEPWDAMCGHAHSDPGYKKQQNKKFIKTCLPSKTHKARHNFV